MELCYNWAMQIIADLHTHSRFSRAVSQKMILSEIAIWSSKKGIDLVSTGDWQHPVWFKEITTQLKEISSGVYALKDRPEGQKNNVNFILTTEISSIYSQGGKLRRIHNLLFAPSFGAAERFAKSLQSKGANIMSDGRPIVGISSRDLLEMALDVDKDFLLISAHAWTPWFSLYGSNSGFDSLEECFGDLSDFVYGVETGLSSDPWMNWQIKDLDKRSIMSYSDAHSAPKLGREATVFVADDGFKLSQLTFTELSSAIKKSSKTLKIGYTIEFFPEEGKYHWSGHRNCGVKFSPAEIKKNGMLCPVCGKLLTIGVEDQIIKLSHKFLEESDLLFKQNENGATFVIDKDKKRTPFVSLVPLLEILLETNNNSPTKAAGEYEKLTSLLGTEFDILLKKSYEEIEKVSGKKLADAIKIVRERKVYVDPGFDGVFGKVKNFKEDAEEKKTEEQKQMGLF